MKGRAISISTFTNKYVTMYPHRDAEDILRRLAMALEDYQCGIRCKCGNRLWVIGSAFEGNTCFKCMMGRAFSEEDLELEEVLNAPNDDQSDDSKEEDDADFVPEYWGYYHDDGTPWNPDLHPKPALCLSCRKNDDPRHEMLCNLSRLGQGEDDEFECYAHECF